MTGGFILTEYEVKKHSIHVSILNKTKSRPLKFKPRNKTMWEEFVIHLFYSIYLVTQTSCNTFLLTLYQLHTYGEMALPWRYLTQKLIHLLRVRL